MGVQLPTAFVKRMEQLLGDEFEAFMAAYDHTPHAGIRVNTLKIPVEALRNVLRSNCGRFRGAPQVFTFRTALSLDFTLTIMLGCTMYRNQVRCLRLNCSI